MEKSPAEIFVALIWTRKENCAEFAGLYQALNSSKRF